MMNTKSVQVRLLRLEVLEREREVYRHAERLARQYGKDVEEVLLELEETAKRIERYGLDIEINRMAREHGKSDDEIRADIEAVIEERGYEAE